MQNNTTDKERRIRINKVIDYILKNPAIDISLQILAQEANYSTFHLHKTFKELMGETPKQYIIKVRLETALLLLVIHPHKSILEIAIDCGFSSPSVFSRAFRNYYGVSPEEIRIPTIQRKILFLQKKHITNTAHPKNFFQKHANLNIQIKKIEFQRGIYIISPFDDTKKIQQSFKELLQLANTYDLLYDLSKIYGIFCPHQGNIYKAFIAINNDQTIPDLFNVTAIKAGKYATFNTKGCITNTQNDFSVIYHQWFPKSGYKIAEPNILEKFAANPATNPYKNILREIFIPIEPV